MGGINLARFFGVQTWRVLHVLHLGTSRGYGGVPRGADRMVSLARREVFFSSCLSLRCEGFAWMRMGITHRRRGKM